MSPFPRSSDPLTILLRTYSFETPENPVFEVAGKSMKLGKASEKLHDSMVQPVVLYRGLDPRLRAASKQQLLATTLSWTTIYRLTCLCGLCSNKIVFAPRSRGITNVDKESRVSPWRGLVCAH